MLIADQVVVNEGFEGPSTGPIEEWVKKNAKALMTSDYGPISKSTDCGVSKKKKKKGPTQECAITIQSAHSRNTSAGLDPEPPVLGRLEVVDRPWQRPPLRAYRCTK